MWRKKSWDCLGAEYTKKKGIQQVNVVAIPVFYVCASAKCTFKAASVNVVDVDAAKT